MYGLSKIHKPLVNGFPKLRPILSAINTGTYKWAKFFVPLLKPFTSNNYTVKDSFDFAKDITQQTSKWFMASFDVIPFSQTCHLMKLLKYVLTNCLNLVKWFQGLTNNKF